MKYERAKIEAAEPTKLCAHPPEFRIEKSAEFKKNLAAGRD